MYAETRTVAFNARRHLADRLPGPEGEDTLPLTLSTGAGFLLDAMALHATDMRKAVVAFAEEGRHEEAAVVLRDDQAALASMVGCLAELSRRQAGMLPEEPAAPAP